MEFVLNLSVQTGEETAAFSLLCSKRTMELGEEQKQLLQSRQEDSVRSRSLQTHPLQSSSVLIVSQNNQTSPESPQRRENTKSSSKNDTSETFSSGTNQRAELAETSES